MKRQITDIREKLIEYKVIATRHNQKLAYDTLPNHVDILLFGPAGSGKSSLIRTFYRSLHESMALPNNIGEQLVIKKQNQNEGTLKYQGVIIKEGTEDGSAIMIHDTRGQIWMDQNEQEQLNLIIQGQVEDKTMVEQRTYRYAYMLWEFWKKDQELFPSQVFAKNKGSLHSKPHCVVFVFDGSMEEIPSSEEETQFYKDIIAMARERKYFYPQIVLTCMDKLDELLDEEENPPTDPLEREQRLREIIDTKIERVVLNLGISRSSVHFIENYKEEDEPSKIQIDYKSLRLLHECVQQSDSFLISNLKEKKNCSIF